MPRFPSAQGRLNHEPDSTLAVTKTCPKDGVHLSHSSLGHLTPNEFIRQRQEDRTVEGMLLQLQLSRNGTNVMGQEQSTVECLPRGEAYATTSSWSSACVSTRMSTKGR